MNPVVYVLLVVLATLSMGSSFTVGKLGLSYMSPLLLAGLRFTLAGLLMVLGVMRKPLPASLKDWFKVFVLGLLQTAGVMGCIFLSLRYITASESSILTFVNPLLVVVMSAWFLKIRYSWNQWLGVIIGFIGVVTTLGFQLQLNAGTLLGLGAAMFWAVATILVKWWGGLLDVWVMTAYQMLFGGLVLLILGFTLETPTIVINPASVAIVMYLAIIGSIVQFSAWYYLLDRGDPAKTSAFLFLAPFFGVLSGWVILGEVVQQHVYIGGLLIFFGIIQVNRTKAVEASQVTKHFP